MLQNYRGLQSYWYPLIKIKKRLHIINNTGNNLCVMSKLMGKQYTFISMLFSEKHSVRVGKTRSHVPWLLFVVCV